MQNPMGLTSTSWLRGVTILFFVIWAAGFALSNPAQAAATTAAKGKSAAAPATTAAPAKPAGANSLESGLASYVRVQQILAADQVDGLKAPGQALAELFAANGDSAAAESARSVSTAKDIKAARESFKKVSLPFVAWAKKAKPTGFEVYHCDMAQAEWIQKSGPIRNPYYGAEMLECGESVHY